VHSITVGLKLPPIVVPMLRVSFMPFSAFGPCIRQSLGDEYASACTFSFIPPSHRERASLRDYPPTQEAQCPLRISFHSPSLRMSPRIVGTMLSTDLASCPKVSSGMIDNYPSPSSS
jgi:hypothetical protein